MKIRRDRTRVIAFLLLLLILWMRKPIHEPNHDPFGRSLPYSFKIVFDVRDAETGEAVDDVQAIIRSDEAPSIDLREMHYFGSPFTKTFMGTDSEIHYLHVFAEGRLTSNLPVIFASEATIVTPSFTDATSTDSITMPIYLPRVEGIGRQEDGLLFLKAIDGDARPLPAFLVDDLHGGNDLPIASGQASDGIITKRFEDGERDSFYLRYEGLVSQILQPEDLHGTMNDPAEVRLFPAAVLSGSVLDAMGSPAPNLMVVANRELPGQLVIQRCAWTDDNGNYQIDGLWPGDYAIHLFPEVETNYSGLSDRLLDVNWSVPILDGVSEDLQKVVDFVGRVHDRFAGLEREIKRAPVQKDEVWERVTYASGIHGEVARIHLLPGESRSFPISGPQVELLSEAGSGSLSGSIHGSPDARGIAFVQAHYTLAGKSYELRKQTTLSKYFVLENLPVETPITLIAESWEGLDYVAKLDNLKAYGQHLDIEVKPVPRIGVEIRDEATGSPIEDVYLHAYKEQPQKGSLTSFLKGGDQEFEGTHPIRHIARDGRFSIRRKFSSVEDFPLGENLWVVAMKNGYSVSYCPVQMPSQGGESVVVSLSMKPAPKITGVVHDTSGNPLCSAHVLLDTCYPFAVNSDRWTGTLWPATSRKDGRFELTRENSEAGHAVVLHPDYAPAFFALPADGEELRCVLDAGLKVSGTVACDGKHHRVGIVKATLLEDSPIKGKVTVAKSGVDGTFTLEHLAPGKYALEVSYPERGLNWPAHKMEIAVPRDDTSLLHFSFDSTSKVWQATGTS